MPSGVMIVESDPREIRELAKILKASAYSVVAEAAWPEEAVEAFPGASPAVVITRLVFPSGEGEAHMGGVDLMKRLRTIDKDVKVVMTFDVGTRYLVMGAVREGAAGRIRRPYKYESVMRALGSLGDVGAAPGRAPKKLKKGLAVSYRHAGKLFGGGKRMAVATAVGLEEIVLKTDEQLKEGTALEFEITLPRLKEPILGRGKATSTITLVPKLAFEVTCSLSGLSDTDMQKLEVFVNWSVGGEGAG